MSESSTGPNSGSPTRLCLLGRDHRLFLTVDVLATPRAAVAICPGGLPDDAFYRHKGDRAYPNEDACCLVGDDDHVLLAVADAHYGREASERFIGAIAQESLPRSPVEFEAVLARLARLPAADVGESETTLLVAWLDRRDLRVEAVSYGDSSLLHLRVEDRAPQSPLSRGKRFVAPGELGFPEARASLRVAPGDLIALYTDGIDDAFGRDRGLTASDLDRIARDCAHRPADFVRAAIEAALGELGDGGRDNLAVVAAAV
ncbi:MAG: SpoIIE family protein phosphatase [Planctomycetota bacterium]